MIEAKKKILDRVNELIDKRKSELLMKIPHIHEIDDGIIIRSFTKWDNCNDNKDIKYKKIVNEHNPNETIVFFFIPKGAIISCDKRDYIHTITTLSGKLELKVDDEMIVLVGYGKTILKSNEFCGRAIEDTYLITSNLA